MAEHRPGDGQSQTEHDNGTEPPASTATEERPRSWPDATRGKQWRSISEDFDGWIGWSSNAFEHGGHALLGDSEHASYSVTTEEVTNGRRLMVSHTGSRKHAFQIFTRDGHQWVWRADRSKPDLLDADSFHELLTDHRISKIQVSDTHAETKPEPGGAGAQHDGSDAVVVDPAQHQVGPSSSAGRKRRVLVPSTSGRPDATYGGFGGHGSVVMGLLHRLSTIVDKALGKTENTEDHHDIPVAREAGAPAHSTQTPPAIDAARESAITGVGKSARESAHAQSGNTDWRIAERRDRLRREITEGTRPHEQVITARNRLELAQAEYDERQQELQRLQAEQSLHNREEDRDLITSASNRLHHAGRQRDEAATEFEDAVERAVDGDYTHDKTEHDRLIREADKAVKAVHDETENQLRTELHKLITARAQWKTSRAAYNEAVADLKTLQDKGLVKSIDNARKRVKDAWEDLEEADGEYGYEKQWTEEPGVVHLRYQRWDAVSRAKELRRAMVDYEALLRAAPGEHTSELAAAARDREDLEQRAAEKGYDEFTHSEKKARLFPWSSTGDGAEPRIGDRTRFDQDVAIRTKALRDQLAAPDRAVMSETGFENLELKSRLDEHAAAYRAAHHKFAEATEGVIGARHEVLDQAGKADKAAFDNGLAERETFKATFKAKRMDAAVKVLEAINLYHEELLSTKEGDRPVAPLTDHELIEMIRSGTPEQRLAHAKEFVHRNHDKHHTPRDTQMLGYLLKLIEMGTGQRKELLMGTRGYNDTIDHGTTHSLTSSDLLVASMIKLYKQFAEPSGGDTPLMPVGRMSDKEPINESGAFVGTQQNYQFRTLFKIDEMLGKFTAAGAKDHDITALKKWLNDERPTLDEMKARLDTTAEHYGLADRFEPFPPGIFTADELDAVYFDGPESVLSPGGDEFLSPTEVERIDKALYHVLAAEKQHGLTDADFGRPERTTGLWRAELTDDAVKKLQQTDPQWQVPHDRADVKLYQDVALALWGQNRGQHYIVTRDKPQIGLLEHTTTDKLTLDRSKGTSTRLQDLGAILDRLNGVPKDEIKGNYADESLKVAWHQIANSSFFKSPSGMSGTMKAVEDALYDQYGIGPVPEVRNFYDPKTKDLSPKVIFDTEQDRLKAMGGMIVANMIEPDGKIELIIKDGNVVTGAWQRGLPHWVVMTNNRSIHGADVRIERGDDGRVIRTIELKSWRDKTPEERGLVDWIDQITDERVRAEINEVNAHRASDEQLVAADEIKLDYRARDAQWFHEHGNGDAAEALANQQTDEWGGLGSLDIVNKQGARGSSPNQKNDVVDLPYTFRARIVDKSGAYPRLPREDEVAAEMKGTVVMTDNGPNNGERTEDQVFGRGQRGGRGDKPDGGYDATYMAFRAVHDFDTPVPDHGVTQQVIMHKNAVEAHDKAVAADQAHSTEQTRAHRETTAANLRKTEQTLLEETAPAVRRAVEQRLLADKRAHFHHPSTVPLTPPATPPSVALTPPESPEDNLDLQSSHDSFWQSDASIDG
ncbi:MAG: hypothetical protein J2P17_06910, partial [Mycobacterium sp.]|nr:hypothetical protein [Mycobacterium sp.]